MDDQGVEVQAGSAGSSRFAARMSSTSTWRRPDETAAAALRVAQGGGRLVPDRRSRGARRRRLPAARADQRGHHQDRRLQGLRARDRRGAAHCTRALPNARWSASPTTSGASGCRRRSNCATARRCRWRTCKAGRSRDWPRTKFRGIFGRSSPCRAMPWEKSPNQRLPRSSNHVNLAHAPGPRPPAARDDRRRRVDGAGDRCGRRAALLPRRWLCRALRTSADAGQRVRHLPAGLRTGAEGSVRHRVGDGLSVRGDQPLDAPLGADAYAGSAATPTARRTTTSFAPPTTRSSIAR